MMVEKQSLIKSLGASRKNLFAIIFLLLNALTWLFATLQVIDYFLKSLETSISQNILVLGTYYLTIVFSSFCGVFFSLTTTRRNVLLIWIVSGIVFSFAPFMLIDKSIEMLTIVSFLLGSSFGFGMPSCLSYFADLTVFENRGHLGGLIFFLASICAAIFTIFYSITQSLSIMLLSLVIWRCLSLVVLELTDIERIERKERQPTPFKRVFETKGLLLYLLPWLMFGLVDSFEKAYLQGYILTSFGQDFFSINQLIETVIGAISALIAGVIADLIGRKRVIVYGFVSLGLAYAMIGVAPFLRLAWRLYAVIDGVAWGIFLVMFTLVVWGDLSPKDVLREKYYVIGSIPLFGSRFISVLFLSYTETLPKESAYAAFSLAAFFLFIAVIPLMYAPETLPEKKIKERELKKYIEKAKKVKEKYG